MKKLLFGIFLAVSFSHGFSAEKIEEIDQFEIRTYSPQKTGLKDLVFEARIDNLTEMLAKNLPLGKLIDVSFKIYWQSPSQYKIEVQGLPKGFQEIRDDLATLIKGKLEYVLPESFSDKFKSYTLKSEALLNGTLVKAIDATYTLAVPEVDIIFDKIGDLRSIETRAPMSSVKNEFFHSPKSWSNNKKVLDKVVSTAKQGTALFTTVNEIEYGVFSAVGLPTKIVIKNLVEAEIPKTEKEKAKKVKQESSTTIRFSKYEVNTGKAARFINEGLRK